LLTETIPRLARVAVLWNPAPPFHAKIVQELKAAAPSLSVDLRFVPAQTEEEIGPAFSAVRRTHAQALYVIDDAIFFAQRAALLKRASKAHLPAIYAQGEFAEEGGLMSYGANFGELFRRSAGYVDKILKGAKPSDIPIEQVSRFELVIDLRVAHELGLAVPQDLLLRANEVIR
jgi:putative ABC transport system substrate-binding protein